jgi:hypothetical protein
MSTTPRPPGRPDLLGFNLPPELAQNPLVLLLLAFLLGGVTPSRPPAPAPAPVPPTPPAPPVIPGPTPAPSASIADRRPRHRINGGEAHVTGIVDMTTPRVQRRLSDDDVDAICANKVSGPADMRIETDVTPVAEDGYVFGPEDPAWVDDPQPGSIDDEEAQPMRLLAVLSSGLSGGVRHVNNNFGCNNWLRVAGRGVVGNLRYVGPDYGTQRHAEIPLKRRGREVSIITVGA